MNNYWKHFKTITKHKLVVMMLCFKCGQYTRGIMHDLSKYGITEFVSSAKHFTGTRSPIDSEKDDIGYSLAWQHHKGHNPHHWEYWIDNVGTYKNTPYKIPYEYVVEMVCDWVGAGIVYSKQKCDFTKPYKEPMEYYQRFTGERIFHKETKELIEYFLCIIRDKGVNAFCEATKDYKSEALMNYFYIP